MSSAEDLAQETFLRGWQGLARLDDPRSFGSWLLSIAGFVCAEWVRKKTTRDPHDERLAHEAPVATDERRDEPALPLAEAIAQLPPDVQQLIALRHDRGLTCEEIARELGKPLGTVTKTLSRVYAELRERLARQPKPASQ